MFELITLNSSRQFDSLLFHLTVFDESLVNRQAVDAHIHLNRRSFSFQSFRPASLAAILLIVSRALTSNRYCLS